MRKAVLRSILLSLIVVVSSLATGVIPNHLGNWLFDDTPKLQASRSSDNKVTAMSNINYKQEMISLVEEISTYSKKKNPSFQVIGNNGLALFQPENVSGECLHTLLNSVDGVIMEGSHYGWEMKDDTRTPSAVRVKLGQAVQVPIAQNLPVLNIDYCYSKKNVDKSYQFNDQSGFVAFAADSRQLDKIPSYPPKIHQENDNNIGKLQQVKNFIVLFNPHAFADKRSYLEKLRNTNYDLLIIDMYFNGDPLTSCEVASLKVKKNGASRLVYSYMSVGEAEDYRSYWKSDWSKTLPKWVKEKNPDWPGNYKVEYWNKDWKQILFGSSDSYLDRVLATGFNGVFMDVIDAFEYFEDKQ